MVEDGRVAALVHALQNLGEVGEALGEGLEGGCDGRDVVVARGGDGVEHERDNGSAAGLDGDGDEVEPRLVKGPCESRKGGQVLEAVDILVDKEGFEIPETDSRVRGHRENL